MILFYHDGNWYENGDEKTDCKYIGETVGEYFGGPHGQGTETCPNGSKYVGEWEYMYKNGQGTKTWSNGEKYVGEWKNGKEWNTKYYDKDGNIEYKVVNGVEQ